jgi:hypothetical protein
LKWLALVPSGQVKDDPCRPDMVGAGSETARKSWQLDASKRSGPLTDRDPQTLGGMHRLHRAT